MTNASCADCGRIVAFRTHDPSEIAECRNCGTWVKRSAEMPGVAVSVKQSGPVARKTAIPPRKDQIKDPAPNPNLNTQRSATKRTSDRPAGNGNGGNGNTMSAASVYAAIRDLRKSVLDLRAGQKAIQEDQKKLQASQQDFQSAQKSLHEGQKALHSGQKQLFEQYQELQQGQRSMMERLLDVPEMPVSKQADTSTAAAIPVGPLTAFEEGPPAEEGFHTTPFSSLKIPLIPLKLEDLDFEPRFTEEGSVPAIPADERSDRVGLIENPLPEPPPYVEPEAAPEPAESEAPAEESQPTPAAFAEVAFNDTAFEEKSSPEPVEEAKEDDPFLTTAAHDSPFTIEGPPAAPFTIAEAEATAGPSESDSKEESPFAAAPQPFGATEQNHEPCELEDPFAEALPETDDKEAADENPFQEAPAAEFVKDDGPPTDKRSLSQQIADAKENQASPFDPARQDLLAEPNKSRALPVLGGIIGLLALIGAILFFFTDVFRKPQAPPAATPPLVEFPPYGIPLPEDDERVTEAEEVAKAFLAAQSQEEVEKVIRPVDSALLVDFWEPMTAPTIERIFQGRILENDRVEVDFLVKDFGRQERLLPLIRVGEGPFQVDWKSFVECEEATLEGLAQGTLILDSGAELDEGAIRAWMQSGRELAKNLDLGNFQGFKLHNFTEQVVAFGVVRKDSPEFEKISQALAATKLKHKGKPAIRAVLKVKRIEKEDPGNNKPARLEILEVISTDWSLGNEAGRDPLIQEDLPAAFKEEEEAQEKASEPASEPTGSEETTAPTDESAAQDAAPAPEEEALPDELPPVPAEDEPLAKAPGETPLFRVSYD